MEIIRQIDKKLKVMGLSAENFQDPIYRFFQLCDADWLAKIHKFLRFSVSRNEIIFVKMQGHSDGCFIGDSKCFEFLQEQIKHGPEEVVFDP